MPVRSSHLILPLLRCSRILAVYHFYLTYGRPVSLLGCAGLEVAVRSSALGCTFRFEV